MFQEDTRVWDFSLTEKCCACDVRQLALSLGVDELYTGMTPFDLGIRKDWIGE